jgi:hypothetical protein
VGDHLSAQRQQQALLASARQLVADNQDALRQLANYKFDARYIKQAQQNLQMLSKSNGNLSQVNAILPDTIGNVQVFLSWISDAYDDEKTPLNKEDFIYSTTPQERHYLTQVFAGTRTDPWLLTENRYHYQLYFPVTIDGKRLVLCIFSAG